MKPPWTRRTAVATSVVFWLVAALGPAHADPIGAAGFESGVGARSGGLGAAVSIHDPDGRRPLVYAQADHEVVARWVARAAESAGANEEHWLTTLHAASPTNVQPRLVRILTNQTGPSLLLRQKAAVALGIVGRPTPATIEAVRRQLPLEAEPMQLSLLWLVSGWSVDAAEALPQVLELRANTSVAVRLLASLAERQLVGNPLMLPSDLTSIVRGRAVHVARNRPGDFEGRAGVWLPATPAPGVPVYFLGASGVYQAVSDAEGAYEIRLPPGTYDVATLNRAPDLSQPAVELLVQRNAGGDLQPIEVQKGQILEVDPAATAAFPE